MGSEEGENRKSNGGSWDLVGLCEEFLKAGPKKGSSSLGSLSR